MTGLYGGEHRTDVHCSADVHDVCDDPAHYLTVKVDSVSANRPCQALLVVEPDHYECDLPVDHRSRHYDSDTGFSWANTDDSDDHYVGLKPRVGDRVWVRPPSYAATVTGINPNGTLLVNNYDRQLADAGGWVPSKSQVRVLDRPTQREPDRDVKRVEGHSGRVYSRKIMSDGIDLWDDAQYHGRTWVALQEHDGPLYLVQRGPMVPRESA